MEIQEYIKQTGEDIHSTENQRIVDKLVNREVFYCVSCLISELARNESYVDELTELCVQYPDNSDAIEGLEEEIERIENDKYKLDELFELSESEQEKYEKLENELERMESEKDELESEQEQPNEAYEHWLISSWAEAKLASYGEITGEFMGMTIWGRCGTGQSISLDTVWIRIACEMGILKGQASDWSKS